MRRSVTIAALALLLTACEPEPEDLLSGWWVGVHESFDTLHRHPAMYWIGKTELLVHQNGETLSGFENFRGLRYDVEDGGLPGSDPDPDSIRWTGRFHGTADKGRVRMLFPDYFRCSSGFVLTGAYEDRTLLVEKATGGDDNRYCGDGIGMTITVSRPPAGWRPWAR